MTREYDDTNECPLHQTCQLKFTLEKDMKAPIFVFYELHNFYQNHRRYIRSKSSTQLAGTEISSSDASSSCDPVYLMKHLGINKSWGGFPLKDDDVANPCGLIAKSVFNGIYLFIFTSFLAIFFSFVNLVFFKFLYEKFFIQIPIPG